MVITLKRNPDGVYLELGGGANPMVHPRCMGGRDVNVDVRICQNAQGQQTTDFTCNFEEPLPIGDSEFDGIFCQYCLEHISWRKVKDFLKEVLRVLKPGCKAVFVTPNTEEQIKWIQNNPNGWDGKDAFESASCVLFGDQDYVDNTHKTYLSPTIVRDLFETTGFSGVNVSPYGTRNTDMVVEATKPGDHMVLQAKKIPVQVKAANEYVRATYTREEMFDKHYFNGGKMVGGYAREGYWDFPVHEITTKHILNRKPESVLEIGCSRGYVLKRIQDRGIRGCGLEISKHCYMTRACEGIIQHDVCNTPWPFKDKEFQLCFSVAVLEHIPEERLFNVLSEMQRVSNRQLHGIDFGEKDDNWDRTHCTLKPKDWWTAHFCNYFSPNEIEILDKEELEKGELPEEVLKGDGKVKLNIGSFTVMAHRNWLNVDIHDLSQFAQAYRYQFRQMDVRQGLQGFATGSVDLIAASHFLEHLTYQEGLSLLRECRRVIKPDGAIRIVVPDARLLMQKYSSGGLGEFDEINEGCADASTGGAKLHALLYAGHSAIYDWDTLSDLLSSAGFTPIERKFRQGNKQMLEEVLDLFPCLSLYGEGVPSLG